MEYRVGEDSSYAEVAEESILIARKRNVGIARLIIRRDNHVPGQLASVPIKMGSLWRLAIVMKRMWYYSISLGRDAPAWTRVSG